MKPRRTQTRATLVGVLVKRFIAKALGGCECRSNTAELLLQTRLLLLASVVPACRLQKVRTRKAFAKVFASPDDAGNALLAAAKSGDQNALPAIFGPDSKDILVSGDPVQDKNAKEAFAAGYGVMHRWRRMPDGSQILLVGADNFPFPIPLKKNARGKWFFDTAAGKEEILRAPYWPERTRSHRDLRSSGGRSRPSILPSLTMAKRQSNTPRSSSATPASRMACTGSRPEGQPESPLGPLVAFATGEGYSLKPDAHAPFHGYYFHMLTGKAIRRRAARRTMWSMGRWSGGFAFVAYPAEYGNSGVMTFIINQDGVLLQKDLGKATTKRPLQ